MLPKLACHPASRSASHDTGHCRHGRQTVIHLAAKQTRTHEPLTSHPLSVAARCLASFGRTPTACKRPIDTPLGSLGREWCPDLTRDVAAKSGPRRGRPRETGAPLLYLRTDSPILASAHQSIHLRKHLWRNTPHGTARLRLPAACSREDTCRRVRTKIPSRRPRHSSVTSEEHLLVTAQTITMAAATETVPTVGGETSVQASHNSGKGVTPGVFVQSLEGHPAGPDACESAI